MVNPSLRAMIKPNIWTSAMATAAEPMSSRWFAARLDKRSPQPV